MKLNFCFEVRHSSKQQSYSDISSGCSQGGQGMPKVVSVFGLASSQ